MVSKTPPTKLNAKNIASKSVLAICSVRKSDVRASPLYPESAEKCFKGVPSWKNMLIATFSKTIQAIADKGKSRKYSRKPNARNDNRYVQTNHKSIVDTKRTPPWKTGISEPSLSFSVKHSAPSAKWRIRLNESPAHIKRNIIVTVIANLLSVRFFNIAE
jgi:hypothetical protein